MELFTENFDNERRLASQTPVSSVDQLPQVTDDPGPSALAPVPPCQAWKLLTATSQGVVSEHTVHSSDGVTPEGIQVWISREDTNQPSLYRCRIPVTPS